MRKQFHIDMSSLARAPSGRSPQSPQSPAPALSCDGSDSRQDRSARAPSSVLLARLNTWAQKATHAPAPSGTHPDEEVDKPPQSKISGHPYLHMLDIGSEHGPSYDQPNIYHPGNNYICVKGVSVAWFPCGFLDTPAPKTLARRQKKRTQKNRPRPPRFSWLDPASSWAQWRSGCQVCSAAAGSESWAPRRSKCRSPARSRGSTLGRGPVDRKTRRQRVFGASLGRRVGLGRVRLNRRGGRFEESQR